MTFYEMVGKEFVFFGVDGNTFKLGETVFETVVVGDEDVVEENDEWCGDTCFCLMSVEEVSEPTRLTFSKTPLAVVRVVRIETDPQDSEDDDFGGYHLIDVSDGHIWLKFGTDGHYYAQYPHFEFDYDPKP